jgi:hypothetical protein
MVTIYVGKMRKEFCIHKKPLCDNSDFFAKAFNSQFKEGVSGILYLPEDSPGSFSLLVEWIYRGILPDGNSEQDLQDLYHLYFLAEMTLWIKLKDDTMDKIQDVCANHDKYVDIELVRKAYKRTPAKSPLREFCLQLMVFQYQEDLNVRTQLLRGLSGTADAEEKIRKDHVETMRELIGGDFDFFDEFFERFEMEFGGGERADPRLRDEGNRENRCRFHCHKQECLRRTWD